MSSARSGGFGGSLLVVAAVLSLAAACSDEDIILAELPAVTDGGLPIEKKRCVSDTDCASPAFCGRHSCDDVGGICFARPVVCDNAASPVCGCDGITYWNDCLRRAAGITSKTDGECDPDVARICTFIASPPGPAKAIITCPTGSYCARLLPALAAGEPPGCPDDSSGTCWSIPAVCPSDPDPDRWTECANMDFACRTTCDAIASGNVHRRVDACP